MLLLLFSFYASGQEAFNTPSSLSQNQEQLKLYPNPAYGEEVYITTASAAKKNILIYDVFGEVVLTQRVANNRIDISKLIPGIYVIQVTQNNETTTRKLVVK